jgi:hypothetical protein
MNDVSVLFLFCLILISNELFCITLLSPSVLTSVNHKQFHFYYFYCVLLSERVFQCNNSIIQLFPSLVSYFHFMQFQQFFLFQQKQSSCNRVEQIALTITPEYGRKISNIKIFCCICVCVICVLVSLCACADNFHKRC